MDINLESQSLTIFLRLIEGLQVAEYDSVKKKFTIADKEIILDMAELARQVRGILLGGENKP